MLMKQKRKAFFSHNMETELASEKQIIGYAFQHTKGHGGRYAKVSARLFIKVTLDLFHT